MGSEFSLAAPPEYLGIVGVDIDWCDDREAAHAFTVIRRDVRVWCEENLHAGWEITSAQLPAPYPFDRDGLYEFTFSFETDSDMLLFKMRWL
jgi:hypothetical protein